MATEKKSTTVAIPIELLARLDQLADRLNDQTGIKVWSRNKLIILAIQDYYFNEISLPVERRKLNLAVDKERRSSSERREKVPVTCAKVHANIDPRQLLQDFEEMQIKKKNAG
jgi:hypothetical protein